MLTTLLILSAIGLVLFICGLVSSSQDLTFWGFWWCAMVVLLGWILCGVTFTYKTTDEIVTANVVREKTASHLTINGDVIATFKDVVTHTFLADRETVKIIRHREYNLYGSEIITSPQWTISEKQ